MSDDLHRLRSGVVLGARDGMGALRIRGEQAFDLLDAVSPRSLFLRDGQALHTLLLDDEGHAWADLYICCDDLDYVLLFEGPTAEQLRERLPTGFSAEVEDLAETHVIIGLDGPYCWELLADLVGPPVIGVPYLALATLPELGGLGLRAGKTGEYGYDLLVHRDREAEVRSRIAEQGRRFDLGPASQEAMDLASLENGFFCVRHPGVRDLGPVELQLQWRLDPRRTFAGVEAVRRAREIGPRRITWFRGGDRVPSAGAAVLLDGIAVGAVVHAARSPVAGAVGFALLDRPVAHPGLGITIDGDPFRTVTVPVLHNRSLFIDAQRHAWASRSVDVFPALVPG